MTTFLRFFVSAFRVVNPAAPHFKPSNPGINPHTLSPLQPHRLVLGLPIVATHFRDSRETDEISSCQFLKPTTTSRQPTTKWLPDQQSRSCPPMALPAARLTLSPASSLRPSARISSSMFNHQAQQNYTKPRREAKGRWI